MKNTQASIPIEIGIHDLRLSNIGCWDIIRPSRAENY